MSRDRDIILVAVCAWLGAALAWPVPRALGLTAVAGAFLARRTWLLGPAALLLTCGLSVAAHDGLRTVRPAPFHGEVELVSDPVVADRGVRVDVRVRGARLEASAFGATAAALMQRAAGELVELDGDIVARPARAPWLDVRHVVGRLRVEDVGAWRRGTPAARAANAVRRLLTRGAESLPPRERPLYTGFVFGDDRGQAPRTVDDFRASGLGHLLAVSGQNVAFVLAAARPLLERLVFRYRLPVTLALVGLFVLVTRAEPSVLRAAAMAGGAAIATALGRRATSRRVLALAVTTLVLVDPLLVGALGFRLSVLASAGIIELSPWLAARLPGPRALADAVAVSVAAQLAVAPLAVATFGGVPVASLPANILAAPAAGPVMVWGLTGGVAAGLLGGRAAMVLQAPTRLLLWWVELVSGTAGRVPLGELRGPHLVGVASALALLVAARHARRVALVRVAGALIALVLITPALTLRQATAAGDTVAPGVQLWRRDAVTVVILAAQARAPDTLEALRHAGVRHVDLLVARSGGANAAEVVNALDDRYGIDLVWAPIGHRVRGATVPPPGTIATVGIFAVTVDDNDPVLLVDVALRRPDP
jgi:competence protein ComEC